ncbi:hypothetical protein C7B80_28505 [Cyanosarcina cf. burmensis CCALA 770]|nr:hypothetical protein C7B80_28505 [Cyanosarcina cf. burmensis CCALA 770]
MLLTTIHALKEWAVAVNAIERGETILLLRKGGIRESGGQFQVDRDEVLLYPTYEHQQPELLKPEYAAQVTSVASGWHPETIKIGSWAKITDIVPVLDETIVNALLPFHVWNEKFIRDRLKWKPRQPVYVLLLRAYKLSRSRQISYRVEYGGCRSWIDLNEAIDLEAATPVLDDVTYEQKVSEIRQAIDYLPRPNPVPREAFDHSNNSPA